MGFEASGWSKYALPWTLDTRKACLVCMVRVYPMGNRHVLLFALVLLLACTWDVHAKTKKKTAKKVPKGASRKRSGGGTYYDGKAGIKELTDSHFPDQYSKNQVWLIMFYKSVQCRKCIGLKPIFLRVAKELNKRKAAGVKVGVVDCHINKKKCAQQGAIDGQAFPQIKMYVRGKTYEYTEETKFHTLATFALSFSEQPAVLQETQKSKCKKSDGIYQPHTKIKNLCAGHFPEAMSQKYVWVIKFYSRYCGNSRIMKREVWDRIAEVASQLPELSDVKLGALDCTASRQNKGVCDSMGIENYPSIKMVRSIDGESAIDSFSPSSAGPVNALDEILAWSAARVKA